MRCPGCNKSIEFLNIDFYGVEHCPECNTALINFNAKVDWAITLKPKALCSMCGRPLKATNSKTLGMGPVCYRRFLKSRETLPHLF